MNSNEADLTLINSLKDDLIPQKVLLKAEVRAALFIICYFIIVSTVMYLIQPFRPNFLIDFKILRFSAEIILTIFSIITFIYFSYLSVIPASLKNKSFKWAIPPLLLGLGIILYNYIEPSKAPSMAGKRPYCAEEVLIYSSLTFLYIIYSLKKAVLFKTYRSTLLSAIGVSLVPAILMHISCMYEIHHVMSHHLGPVLLFALLVPIICKILIKNKM